MLLLIVIVWWTVGIASSCLSLIKKILKILQTQFFSFYGIFERQRTPSTSKMRISPTNRLLNLPSPIEKIFWPPKICKFKLRGLLWFHLLASLLHPVDTFKVNFDAVCCNKESTGASAALARNLDNQLLGQFIKRLPSISNPLFAKAWAYREAVLLNKYKGFDRVIIEGDALDVIQAIQGSSRVPLAIASLVSNI